MASAIIPKELTSDADCVNGANLMLHSLLELAKIYA